MTGLRCYRAGALAAAAGVVTIVAGAWLAFYPADDGPASVAGMSVGASLDASRPPSPMASSPLNAEGSVPSSGRSADDPSRERGRRQQILMTEVPPESIRQQVAPEDLERASDGRRWMRYDMQVMAARGAGDTFVLTLPGLPAVRAQIDRLEEMQGLQRWTGRLESGGRFAVTHAAADQYAIGAFQMYGVEWLMEAKKGLGWVADASQEFRLPEGQSDGISDPSERPRPH